MYKQLKKRNNNAEDSQINNTFLNINGRVSNRTFPSIFASWKTANNLQNDITTMSKYDLFFGGPNELKLKWNNDAEGISDGFKSESVTEALEMRRKLLSMNPNMLLLAEIRYFDARTNFFGPKNKESEYEYYWKHDKDGKKVPSFPNSVYQEYMKLDFSNQAFQEAVVKRVKSLINTGVVDGILLDNWRFGEDDSERLQLLRKIRAMIGDEKLIMVNLNDHTIPKNHAELVNGAFMECYQSSTVDNWKNIINTLEWCKKNLLSPQIVCLELWDNNQNLQEDTSYAVLAAIFDSYFLFADNNKHIHNWKELWNKKFGKPTSSMKIRHDGAFEKEFQEGTLVYNPMWNKTIKLNFEDNRINILNSDRIPFKKFKLEPGMGGIYLKSSLSNML